MSQPRPRRHSAGRADGAPQTSLPGRHTSETGGVGRVAPGAGCVLLWWEREGQGWKQERHTRKLQCLRPTAALSLSSRSLHTRTSGRRHQGQRDGGGEGATHWHVCARVAKQPVRQRKSDCRTTQAPLVSRRGLGGERARRDKETREQSERRRKQKRSQRKPAFRGCSAHAHKPKWAATAASTSCPAKRGMVRLCGCRVRWARAGAGTQSNLPKPTPHPTYPQSMAATNERASIGTKQLQLQPLKLRPAAPPPPRQKRGAVRCWRARPCEEGRARPLP